MKRTMLLVTAMLAVVSSAAYADHLFGPQEVSVSGQFGALTRESEVPVENGPGFRTVSQSSRYMTLALRYGLFVYRGLEIEPEVYWTAIEDLKPALSLHANAAYNFLNLETISGLRPVTPFVLAGYGIGNAAPFFHSFIGRTSNEWDVSVLNLGAGMKAFLSESTALRAEYRFQRYMYDDTVDGVTSDITDSFQSVLFGFSLFFPPRRDPLPMDHDAGDAFWQ